MMRASMRPTASRNEMMAKMHYQHQWRNIQPMPSLIKAHRQLHLSLPACPPVKHNMMMTRVSREQETYDEDEYEDPLEELSQARHLIVTDTFLAKDLADDLRGVFDERFKDPRSISPERFMWDYWHVPKQYTLVRTQAQVYFPKPNYERLVDALIEWGEEKLGCGAISPIWCSYYIDGCQQELHTDSYHGPFAFVLSLTHWEDRTFRGGETMILNSTLLDYWSSFDSSKGLEQSDLVDLVDPAFNRLTIFDPRRPHGVKRVSGTHDPREARLVLHGWFAPPQPTFNGGLSEEEGGPVLQEVIETISEIASELPEVAGLLTLRFTVDGKRGTLNQGDIEWVADTLVPISRTELPVDQIRAGIQAVVLSEVSRAEFPSASDGADTRITLPIVFG